MYALLGERLHWDDEGVPLAEVIRRGHAMLVQCLRLDLGYDPRQWHEYLSVFDEGGYRWCNKHEAFPPLIERAMSDPQWQDAVGELKGEQAFAGAAVAIEQGYLPRGDQSMDKPFARRHRFPIEFGG